MDEAKEKELNDKINALTETVKKLGGIQGKVVKTETKTDEKERKMKEGEWRDILGISAKTKLDAKMIKRIAELHRDRLTETLDKLEKKAMEGDIPKIQKKKEYLEGLVKKYQNPEFSEILYELDQVLNYFEKKDEIAQIDRAEHYGINECLKKIREILGEKQERDEELGERMEKTPRRKPSITSTTD